MHHLAPLITEHGYWVTFVGALLEGETILALAGLTAQRGYLHLPLLMVIGAIGGFVGDQIYFAIGRRAGTRLLARFPRFQPFSVLNAVGAAIWSVCWVGAGYLTSETVEMMYGNLHHVERVLFAVAAIVALVASIVLHWQRRRNASRGPLDNR